MFKIFRRNDEYENKLIKQCPSCHGFIKSHETKCRHCGRSIQLKQTPPAIHKESDDQSDDKSGVESEKFSI